MLSLTVSLALLSQYAGESRAFPPTIYAPVAPVYAPVAPTYAPVAPTYAPTFAVPNYAPVAPSYIPRSAQALPSVQAPTYAQSPAYAAPAFSQTTCTGPACGYGTVAPPARRRGRFGLFRRW